MNDDLTDRQLAIHTNQLFIQAARSAKQPEQDPVEPAPISGVGKWVARALVAEAALVRQAADDQLTVDGRMLTDLRDDGDRIEWTSQRWSEHLRCSKTAVQKTPTWATIKRMRDQIRHERGEKMRQVTGRKKT